MALIKCYECEKEISDKAPACPHCGAPKEEQPPELEEAKILESVAVVDEPEPITHWSEGSVFVILGMACEDKELMLEGFKLSHENGHKMAPALGSTLHKRLKAAKVVESHETESKEQVLEWITSCINDLENRIEDSKVVEAFLADISEDPH